MVDVRAVSEGVVQIVVFQCRECGHLGQPISVWYVDRSGGEHRCANCGNVCGIWLDGGELDLGLVEVDDDNDFVIYA